jgi:transcriptional regulator with XRE-family HTH domain
MLKEWLDSAGLRQVRIADKLGVTPGYVCQLISGEKRPSLELAAKIELATDGAVSMRDWFTPEEIAAMRAEIAKADARNAALKEAS